MVVIIDECQELERISTSFWSQMQRCWDLYHNKSQMLLVMTGTSGSDLKRIFCDIREPIYGRIDLLLEVRPFSNRLLADIVQNELPQSKLEDLLTLYALTGGVARYVEFFVDSGVSGTDEMIDLIFSPAGVGFREEG